MNAHFIFVIYFQFQINVILEAKKVTTGAFLKIVYNLLFY